MTDFNDKTLEEKLEDVEVKAAMDAVMKMHGAKEVRMASPGAMRKFRMRMYLAKWKHLLGIHQFMPMTKYDHTTGSSKYMGLVCFICGMESY